MNFWGNKKILFLAGILLIFGVIIFLRFFLSPEDSWICENGVWVKHGNPRDQAPISGCEKNPIQGGEEIKKKDVSISAPPSDILYCEEKGGTVEVRVRGDGKKYSVCVFPRGRECETNSFMEEQCPKNGASILGFRTQAAFYCTDMGGTYRATRDKYYMTYREKGVCSFINGRTCPSEDFWNGTCERSIPTLQELQKPEVISVSEALVSVFSGKMIPDDPLIKTYGEAPDVIFRKNSLFVSQIRRFVPSFEASEMKRGLRSIVAELPDKRKLFIFGGCSADGCLGTRRIAAYDQKKNKMYFMKENEMRSELSVYGLPEEQFKNALFSVYFSLE